MLLCRRFHHRRFVGGWRRIRRQLRVMSWRPKPFQQFFKLFPLFRRELLANLLPDILQHLVHLRRDIGPNLAVAFLAVGDDFGNRGALFPCEVKRVVKL